MPWQTPTLSETRKLSRDAVAAALDVTALPTTSPARVVADANAGLAHLVLLYIDWLSGQFLPDTSEAEWLRRWGDILFGGPKQASFASGTATITGLAGIAVPAGSQLLWPGPAGGLIYETTQAITAGSAATAVGLRALQPGAAGNRELGDRLSFTTAIAGIDATATVVTMAGGADAEKTEDLRGRVLDRFRKPPMGGDADDYVAWALEVPGVTRAWCSPREMGLGTVTVRFMMDDLRADQDGFPTEADAAVVHAHIEARRPVTAIDLFVVPPIPEPVDFEIRDLVDDDESTLANVVASIRAMLRERGAPARAVNGERLDAQTIHKSWVSEAISAAAGVDHFDLRMDDHPMPSPGHLGVLGSIGV